MRSYAGQSVRPLITEFKWAATRAFLAGNRVLHAVAPLGAAVCFKGRSLAPDRSESHVPRSRRGGVHAAAHRQDLGAQPLALTGARGWTTQMDGSGRR